MWRLIKYQIGNGPVQEARVEGDALTIRLPADLPPHFQGQLTVTLESDPTETYECVLGDGLDDDCDGSGSPSDCCDICPTEPAGVPPHPEQ
jgi:hypothetical protein